jgi:hypothetical protein
MTPTEKADLIERSSQYLERLFQAGVIPADTLLNGVRNSQLEVGITSTITDDDVNAVKGKYLKDLSPQADPFGGIFQGNEGGEVVESGESEQPENNPEIATDLSQDKENESGQVNTPQNENTP